MTLVVLAYIVSQSLNISIVWHETETRNWFSTHCSITILRQKKQIVIYYTNIDKKEEEKIGSKKAQ